jgi:hypothetical protein
MSVCIFASELAIITGHNTYQNIDEYTAKLWQKNFPIDYADHLKLYENRECVEVIQQTPEEMLACMAKANNIDISKCLEAQDTQVLRKTQTKVVDEFKTQKKYNKKEVEAIEKCLESNNATEIKKNSAKIIEAIKENKDIKPEEKAHIEKCIKTNNIAALKETKTKIVSAVKEQKKFDKNEIEQIEKCVKQVGNTNFGTKNEVNTLNKYNTTNKKNIKTTQQFFRKPLFKTTGFQWAVGGKIDGLDEDEDTIIEFKNRVNRLFYKLRDYEKVQTMTYMYLLDKQKSRLVESLKGRGETQMNVIEVSWDQEFWDNEIVSKVQKFAKRFEKLMSSTEEKLALIGELF